ncbi:MAG: PilZ domain-containing protein [Acidobacteriota bacterium]
MYEAAARSLRTAERFLLEPPISAQFASSAVAVCDISARGARFRHGQPLEMGQKSVLRLTIEGRPMPLSLEAVVVWTQHDASLKGKFVSGVRTYGEAELVNGMLGHLRQTHRANRIEDLRSSDRFDISPMLDGEWNGFAVRIENLSARGGRIETPNALSAGTGTLRFMNLEVAAKVAWSAVKGVEPSRYRNGLAIAEKSELLRLAIAQLCENGRASLDTHSLGLKLKILRARARQLAPSYRNVEAAGIPVEQYLLVQGVREELRLNPDEAMHWYRRARITIADPTTRTTAPAIADHPDALAVWEYLDRSIDASIIGRTFEL